MDENMELHRLTKENENFRKIIKTQQSTLNRMIDHFILKDQNARLHK
ncbi:MAG: adenylate kinase [Roseburia sp.]|nr:adenylate kinase [Roseburia sp.]